MCPLNFCNTNVRRSTFGDLGAFRGEPGADLIGEQETAVLMFVKRSFRYSVCSLSSIFWETDTDETDLSEER
jgi:hypothetical protein